MELIDWLFLINAQRREAWFKGESVLLVPLDLEVRRQVQHMQERRDLELASGKLRGEPEKILRSMQRHWTGLTAFVEHPWVPMDNNAAERANMATERRVRCSRPPRRREKRCWRSFGLWIP